MAGRPSISSEAMDQRGTHMRIDPAINTVFDSTNQRTKVVFRELLSLAQKNLRQHPTDKELVDLVSRARLISANFDGSKK
jgi:hypothetical protein